MPQSNKKILLFDKDDSRRETRQRMLLAAGYETELRKDISAAQSLDHEATFDLVIIAFHQGKVHQAAEYSEMLRKKAPSLPVLLLTDVGVFVPRGTLSRSMQTGFPSEMMQELAEMLAGSTHIREI